MLDLLTRRVERVGVYRPVARSTTERDYVLDLLLAHDSVDLSYEQCVGVTYEQVHEDPEAALSEIVARYHEVQRCCDVVVIVGTDYTCLLYTSDAADDLLCVDLGGRRIIKKKK